MADRVKVIGRQLMPAVVSSEDVDLDSLAYGFMGSQALFAGLELKVFDHLSAKGGLTARQVAEACGAASSSAVQTLLTALVASKCLQRKEGKYQNSPNVEKFMVSSSKAYYGDYLRYQMGRLFYAQMGELSKTLKGEKTMDYSTWFSDPEVASTYTHAQHNGSMATAKVLFRKVPLTGIASMLDVGGGSGAFSLQAVRGNASLRATVLELPEVCRTSRKLMEHQASPEERERLEFRELDAREPSWPVAPQSQDLVLMSYLCGSVPEEVLRQLFANAWQALKPSGRLILHDFMVDDSMDGPLLGALWALQHVTVNPEGMGLTPGHLAEKLKLEGFQQVEAFEMIPQMTKVVMGRK